MQKSFDITIDDQQPINPNNSFAIYRGDNVAFNFTFQRGGISLDVDGATLRVFAKKIGKSGAVDKLSLPLFAEDFVATNTATFNSSKTCGDAGNYILSVLLVSSDDAVITSQCIYFELKENGYAGEYQPSADFRDEVLNASELAQQSSASAQASAINAQQSEANAKASEQIAQQSATNASESEANANLYSIEASNSSSVALQSKEQAKQFLNETTIAKNEAILAKEQAQEISDPENRIGNLQQTKANCGVLYFNKGTLTCSQIQNVPVSFSMCRRFAFTKAFWDSIDTSTKDFYFDGSFNGFKGISFCKGKSKKLGIGYGNGGIQWWAMVNLDETNSLMDGNVHSLVGIGANNELRVYIDNKLCSRTSITSLSISFAPERANQIVDISGLYFDIYNFNFDISDANAPYTLLDYQQGKPIPPLLLDPTAEQGAELALENFTFNGKVFDTSGNNNTATITGIVKGTYDNAVEQMYQAFSSRIGNLT